MQNVSMDFQNELNNDNRRYIKSCDITLADGTTFPIDNSRIWSNGFKLEDAISGTSSFDIGSAIIGKFTLVLNNIYDDFSDYDFTGAVISNIRVGLQLPDGTIESVKKGIFTVDEPTYNGSIITLECLDNMAKFDHSYSESNLTYPATLGAIVRDACSRCGVSLAADSATFENDDYIVQSRPDDDSLTFRQVLVWVGQISCHWCRCNEDGQLSLGWYDLETYENVNVYDGGILPEYTEDIVNAGTFENPASDILDAGTFEDRNNFHHIYSIASMNICTDDVVITGIRVVCEETVQSEDEESVTDTEDVVYQSGHDGYVLSIEGNKLIQDGKGSEVAEYLGSRLIGLRFRPLSVSCLSDPTMEAGDIALVTDRKGRTYSTLITSTTFSSGNYQQVSCDAETPSRKSATRYSESTRIYKELRKKLSHNKSEWEKAVGDLASALASSSGLYITTEEQEDGSSIYYMHNKKTLAESDIVWKLTAEAFGISTDGGKTYPFGFKVTGEMITKILNTIGVNADWINTGALVVKDANGNVLFLADIDNQRVEMNVISLTIQGKTVEEIAQQEAEDLVNAVAGDLQDQIDGKIQSYDQTTDPSSSWSSSTYADHTGDIWKNGDNFYRWNGTKWVDYGVPDAAARKLAEARATVFVSTPTPPYKAGDMWVTSTEDGKPEYKTCIKARTSGSYVSTDWIKPKYTDDSAVTALDNKLNTTEEIFNRLTQNGAIKGIYMKDNQLYFSFTYAQGGTLKLGGSNNGNGLMQILDSSGNVIGTINNTGVLFNKGEINGPKLVSDEGVIAGMTLNEDGLRYGSPTYKSMSSEHKVYVGKHGVVSDNGEVQSQLSEGALYILRNGTVCGYITSGDGSEELPLYNYGFFDGSGTIIAAVMGNSMYFYQSVTFTGPYYVTVKFKNDVKIEGDLTVSGTKNRVVDTQNYGERLQYCYETAAPYFGDMGFGVTDETGVCLVEIDDIFQETVDTQEYLVFLQAEGDGRLYVNKQDKFSNYFIVRGTPNLAFSWEIKCIQNGYQHERLESPENKNILDYQDDTEKAVMVLVTESSKETETVLLEEIININAETEESIWESTDLQE